MPKTLRLTVVEDGVSTIVEFNQPVVGIGRSLDNRVSPARCPSIPPARVDRAGGDEFVVVDNDSANGTRLNGEDVERAPLSNGDWIEIGKTKIGIGEIDVKTQIDGSGRLHALPAGAQDTFVSIVTRERDNLLVLQRINRAINSERDIETLFGLIVDSAIVLTKAERGFLALRGGNASLEFKIARNFAREAVAVPEEKLSRKIVEEVLQNGRPIVSSDALSDDRFAGFGSVVDLELRSVLAVPLRVREKTEGDRRRQPAPAGPLRRRRDRSVGSARRPGGDRARERAHARGAARGESCARRLRREARGARARACQQSGKGEEALEQALEEAAVARSDLRGRYDYRNIIGESEAMREVFRLLDRVVRSDAPVLISGESGTGKELIARAIHSNSSRRDRPFVSASCAAIQESLLESELFGHARGAFTGAHRAKKGLFELADGGTLFLDEVAEMPAEMQKALLRVLQEGEIRPIGTEAAIPIDVRIICASQADLTQKVKDRSFREDLYYRLNVLPLRLPPLRERKGDVPLLVQRFLLERCREAGVATKKIDSTILALFMTYDWPGNVRELENEVRRLVVVAGEEITPEHVSDRIRDFEPDVPDDPELATDENTLPGRVRMLEIRAIRSALLATHDNRSQAARRLGISRFALQRKIDKYGIQAPPESGAAP